MNNIYIGLVHYPVYNKTREIVSTSLTNLDLHDIARTSKTFNIRKFFIINPLSSQKKIFNRIKNFWDTDIAKKYNIARFNAFDIIEYVDSIAEAKKCIKKETSDEPIIFTTSARKHENSIKYSETKKLINSNKTNLILFGTAHGLTEKTIEHSDYIIEEIDGVAGYNHLSVRSAIAITLDRIISDYK